MHIYIYIYVCVFLNNINKELKLKESMRESRLNWLSLQITFMVISNSSSDITIIFG